MSAWHADGMERDAHDAHDQANAEFIALLRVAIRPLEPWTEADDDAPLADLRQVTPGSSERCRAENGAYDCIIKF